MLSRLYSDPAHMDHVVGHLIAHVETLRTPTTQPQEEARQ
jgi:hypothetical protein